MRVYFLCVYVYLCACLCVCECMCVCVWMLLCAHVVFLDLQVSNQRLLPVSLPYNENYCIRVEYSEVIWMMDDKLVSQPLENRQFNHTFY